MKVDFHCHTKKIKSGDPEKRNVTKELFKEKISMAEVKIVAITNHNYFDIDQYKDFMNEVKEFCSIWPGVEIDILEENSSKYHLIVIANPTSAENFSENIKNLFRNEDLETVTKTFEEVYSALDSCDVFYIPHYHKSPGIREEDIENIEKIVSEKSRIFYEASNYKSLHIFANNNISVLIGSDVKNWDEYEKSNFANLRLPIETFSQFCQLAKRDVNVVETLLNKKQKYKLEASPYRGIRFNLSIYEEVNIIFGQKGTGKSEILVSLCESLKQKGKSCIYYCGSTKEEKFKELLEISDMKQDISLLGASSCENDFDTIKNWSEKSITEINRFNYWYRDRNNSKSKKKMRITEISTVDDFDNITLESTKNDKESILKIEEIIQKIVLLDYISNEDKNKLEYILKKLVTAVKNKYNELVVDKFSAELLLFTIDTIKQIADTNTDSVSKPSTIGFYEFVINRINLQKSISNILENISKEEYNNKKYLGTIAEKGKIYINKKYRMLCANSIYKEYPKDIQITNLRDIHEKLIKVKENIWDNKKLMTKLSKLRSSLEKGGIISCNSFLGLSKQVVLEDLSEYTLSSGEKSILLLQNELSKEADAYFLDEPELGMGNSYIDSVIRPKISNLGMGNKVVVIATHNANIAVRTRPYMTIFREYANGEYRTFVGNPFNDKLIDINGSDEENKEKEKSWTEESIHTLESGEEAFYERKDIYESKNN